MNKKNVYAVIGDAKDSKRSVDSNGYLNVAESILTKECVDSYKGFEIPNYENMMIENERIDPNKVYKIYRPAEELKKSIELFNQLPILDGHYAFDPKNPIKDKIVGAVGSNAKFSEDGVSNSMTFWSQDDAIDPIKYDVKRELSMGYTYDPKVEKGEWVDKNGNTHEYNIIMTNITPNHLALVEQGRVKGAKVFDSNINKEEKKMEEKDKKEIIENVMREVKNLIGDELKPIKEALEEKKENLKAKVEDTTPIETVIKDALEKDKMEAKAKEDEELAKDEEEKREAREEVREVMGDSVIPTEYKANDIYKMALDSIGVNHKTLKDNEIKIAFSVAKSLKSSNTITTDSNINVSGVDDYFAKIKTNSINLKGR